MRKMEREIPSGFDEIVGRYHPLPLDGVEVIHLPIGQGLPHRRIQGVDQDIEEQDLYLVARNVRVEMRTDPFQEETSIVASHQLLQHPVNVPCRPIDAPLLDGAHLRETAHHHGQQDHDGTNVVAHLPPENEV